jgi:glutaredoxin
MTMATAITERAGTAAARTATIYRMVMDKHVCPYGVKAKHLLKSRGYAVDDRHLTTREATDAFKAQHGVQTTPQVFIDGRRIGGYDDLGRFFGKTAIWMLAQM